jgi:integrase
MTNPRLLPAASTGSDPWDQALYAFLVEKGNRSGSRRTVEGYGRMLWPFFADLGKTPDLVTPADVFAWAHGIGKSGRTPSATTVGARIACLSSFFRFCIRMELLTGNPCDALQRPRAAPPPARGLSAEDVRRLLAVVPDTARGRRDRAILLTFILTGRRRTEVLSLKAGDVTVDDGTAFYSYHGKGGKAGRRELPRPAFEAIVAALADAGKELATMTPDASLWRVSSGTFYGRFRRYLEAAGLTPTGLHVLRHSAAKLRRDAGETVEQVSAFLDHSSLSVTTVYLRRLEGVEDRAWHEVAVAIGV